MPGGRLTIASIRGDTYDYTCGRASLGDRALGRRTATRQHAARACEGRESAASGIRVVSREPEASVPQFTAEPGPRCARVAAAATGRARGVLRAQSVRGAGTRRVGEA